MRRLLLALLILLVASVSIAGTYTRSTPSIGRVVCYGDSLCNSLIGDWPKVLVDAGITVGVAGIGGASASLVRSPATSLEEQMAPVAACTFSSDLFGTGTIDTCVASIAWNSNDTIVTQIGTNDVSPGAASVWDANFGLQYQTAMTAALVPTALVPAKCIVLNPVTRADNVEKDALIPGALRTRTIAAIAAGNPNCQLVDTWTPFDTYRAMNGTVLLQSLFDAGNVHPTSIVNSLGDNGVSIAGNIVLAAIRSAFSSEIPAGLCISSATYSCSEAPISR